MKRSAATVADLLREGTNELRDAGIESPGRDAEILLREAIGATRVQLFDALPYPVQPTPARKFRELISRRVSGVPIAYITGRRGFYAHEFLVNEHVLVPRPETEFLVEFALSWLSTCGDQQKTIVDVGTGSGAIGISVALETSGIHQIIASDVSAEALELARQNRDLAGANVELVKGSLLDWCQQPIDLIMANLPYLRADQAHEGIAFEPSIALYAGEEGFALSRQLLEQAPSRLNTPGALIMELDPAQAGMALETGSECFPGASVEIRTDLAGTDRYLVVEQS